MYAYKMATELQDKRLKDFERAIVRSYLKYESIDKMVSDIDCQYPFSIAALYRILDNYGVVKNVGRQHTNFAQAILFLDSLVKSNFPLEKCYRLMPHTFQISLSSLHRILHSIKMGVTNRFGVALAVSLESDPYSLLMGNDISTPRVELGKPQGALSFPMGFSSPTDSHMTAVKRILQREMFVTDTVNRAFPEKLLEGEIKPFMYLTIADVKVGVYRIILPNKFRDENSFSSYKLTNFKFTPVTDLVSLGTNTSTVRSGVLEVCQQYTNQRFVGEYVPVINSQLNQRVLAYASSD